jgi:GNAT superfamily N-acetyltransferase
MDDLRGLDAGARSLGARVDVFRAGRSCLHIAHAATVYRLGSGRETEVIRDAGIADAVEIRALMDAVAGFWDETWRPDVLDRVLGASGTIALVHQGARAIDGFICAHDVGFRAYLSELVVSPQVQHRGIGSRLLSEVERRLVGRGCALIIADVWRDAEGFYRARGWTPPAAVLLRKRLSTSAA